MMLPNCSYGIILLLLYCLNIHSAEGQSIVRLKRNNKNLAPERKLYFYRLSTHDGLAFSKSRGIRQDNLGFIWIQHNDGLSRFDGYSFKWYKYDPDNPLRTNLNFLMTGLLLDKSDNLYIKGNQHIYKHDQENDRFIPIPIDIQHEWHNITFDPDERRIWVGTHNMGLYELNKTDRAKSNYMNPHSDKETETETKQNDINSVVDLGDNLLLATVNGLWLFNKINRTYHRPPVAPSDSAFLYRAFCVAINTSREGNFLLRVLMENKKDPENKNSLPAYRNELIKLSSNLSIINRYQLPEDLEFNAWAFRNESLWLANQGQGIFHVNLTNGTIENYRHNPNDPYSISSDIVWSVYFDKEDNLWMGTEKGVSILRKRYLEFSNWNVEGGMIDASSLFQTKTKEYLILSQRQSSIQMADNPNKILLKELKSDQSFKSPMLKELITLQGFAINNITRGSNKIFLAAPGQGIYGLAIDKNTGEILPNIIQKFQHDPENSNTISHWLTIYSLEDKQGNIWVANKRTGLDKINQPDFYGKEGSIKHFKHDANDSSSLQDDRLYYLYREGKDSLWVITETGLDLMIGITSLPKPVFKHVFIKKEPPWMIKRTLHNGLLLGTTRGLYHLKKNDTDYAFNLIWNKTSVNSFLEDANGNLWIYGSGVLGFQDRKNNIQIEFAESDGVAHLSSDKQDGIHQTADGKIVLVDQTGITAFDPALLTLDTSQVSPVFTHLSVNNIPFTETRYTANDIFNISSDITRLHELEIDYKHNNFSLEFSAMEMTSPEKNLYRHQLEGYDKDWIETDYKNRTATYTNLPDGEYTFRVKASNHHGVWSDNERTLKVIILPPPWRTWWAYTGYSLLAAGLLVLARRNIVQRERLKSSLALAKVEQEKEHFELEKAKEVDKIKTSFFTNISHEFRTPLTLIKGPAQEMLEQYSDDPKLRSKLKLIENNSDHLLRLINQLLDLAKLESGSLKVEKTQGDVFSFVRAITSSFESFARQKNVSLQLSVPDESFSARFDKDKLETILINLINNAIKFTPSGGIVRVSALIDLTPGPSPQARGKLSTSTVANNENSQSKLTPLSTGEGPGVRLTITDTGIGIPLDQQQKIFERFHQVSEVHKEVGTGIGLALVKELVSLMGGTIEVKSGVGKGSEFKVALPLEIIDFASDGEQPPVTSFTFEVPVNGKPATPNQQSETMTDDAQPKPHILVVEDNHDLRSFIIDCLGNEFNYLEGENGKQGLDVALQEIPDLIISDVMMPQMDGITMAGKLKSDIHTSHIPLILLTAKSTEDSKLHGLESGADDYLTKPFNKQELLLKVRNAITRQLKLRERLRAELMSTAPKVAVLSADEVFLNTVKENILNRLSDEQLSVESLAESMNMSRVHLYRKVSALTGLSVNELIRKLRLQKAAQLLQQKWGPVSQVAYEVGFSNLSYFSKVFKEEFGLLPSEYPSK